MTQRRRDLWARTQDRLDGSCDDRLAFRPMNRAMLTVFLVGAGLLLAIPACDDPGVGDPCVPDQEYEPSFRGFDEKEVITESKSFQCRTRLCLVNHFRGRASCTYGQSADGSGPSVNGQPTAGCKLPGSDKPVTGLKEEGLDPSNPNNYLDPNKKATVPAQCVDRTADKAVYCSCRCADINGQKPSDQNFCTCPEGFSCKSLVTSTGQGNEGLTGSYCIKDKTDYDENTACKQDVDCNPVTQKCGQ